MTLRRRIVLHVVIALVLWALLVYSTSAPPITPIVRVNCKAFTVESCS